MAWEDYWSDQSQQLADEFTNGLSILVDAEFANAARKVTDPATTQVTKIAPDAPAVPKGAAASTTVAGMSIGKVALAVAGAIGLGLLIAHVAR